jgi:8-hydroxy-5-deazaflavin:NADPH oxidoreductase
MTLIQLSKLPNSETKQVPKSLLILHPEQRFLKAFNHVVTSWIQGVQGDMNTVLFVAGDDLEAKTKLLEIIRSSRFHAVDVGSLKIGGSLLQLGGSLNGLLLKITERHK